MMPINIPAGTVRAFGGRNQDLRLKIIELKQVLQRILADPRFRPVLREHMTQIDYIVRRLSEEEALLAESERKLFGIADTVDAISAEGRRVPPSFHEPRSTYTCLYPAVASPYVCRFPAWYNDPSSIRWLSGLIYERRTGPCPPPFDWRFGGLA